MASDGNQDRRPDPDALLALTGREGRGKLKVFLGAAPGVGKTYAMLLGARRLRDEGVDVVIGLVETHGRAETLALLEGLEILPRQKIDYRGRELEEFDLDAALKRRPALIVVDELAHSNPPDCRHPKRWQDVEELLDAGLDVWTALNIQHLESLAEVVSRVTGVLVRETVPDRVLKAADDVMLVDITPDELIQRLKEGKIYLPQTAKRAVQNFFTTRNLTALREIALRRTADRVDDQMVDYLRQNAIEGPWETSEHILVCVGADARAVSLIRAASRMATGLNAGWVVAHVEAGGEDCEPEQAKRIDDAFRLAERLGAETVRLSGQDLAGQDPAGEVLRYARRENVTQIVLGRPRPGLWRRLTGKNFAAKVLQLSTEIPVQMIGAPEAEAPAWRRPKLRLEASRLWMGLAASVGSVIVAVLVGEALQSLAHLPNLSMVFLLAVLVCAAFFGVISSISASFLSFLAYNFFFIPPVYTFTVAEPQELFSLLVFLVVAMLTGSLAGRVHDQAEAVRQRALHIELLYDFSRKLSGAAKLDDALWAAAANLQKVLGGHVALLLPENGDLRLAAVWPPREEFSAGEMSAARWAFSKREPAGWRTDTLPNLPFQFRPLITPRGVVGVCGFEPKVADEPMSHEDERALTAMLEQAAIAIDRSQLQAEALRAAALEDNEKLRTTLLSSLSHDLRTPLSSITGAVTSLRQLGDKMSVAERQDLLASIEEEAARLSRFVSNLLDMSRIESGAVKVRRDFLDPADVIRAAAERCRKTFPDLKVETSLAPNLPYIRGDSGLLEQVLFNLLDNAQKYGGDSGAIVHARPEGKDVLISVTDEGPGIKPADLERVFEKFYRGGRPDGRKAGTGLGLSICKGLVEAMGGAITAQSPAVRRRGARIILRFPAAQMKAEALA